MRYEKFILTCLSIGFLSIAWMVSTMSRPVFATTALPQSELYDSIFDDGDSTSHAKIAVNTETASQLTTDLDLTAEEAASVVNYRTRNGKFRTIEDLKKVPGVDGEEIDAYASDLLF